MATLSFKRYQEAAAQTRQYPNIIVSETKEIGAVDGGLPLTLETTTENCPFVYSALGLAGETGELIEKLKKAVRNNGGKISGEELSSISAEVGDVLWYLADVCTALGISLEDCANGNIAKLFDRKSRDVIKSEGDNR